MVLEGAKGETPRVLTFGLSQEDFLIDPNALDLTISP